MKKLNVLSSLLVLVLVLAACAPQPHPRLPSGKGQDQHRHGQLLPVLRLLHRHEQVRHRCGTAYPNVEIISTDANGDAAKLNSDIEDLIAKKVDGIIISGAWLEQLPSAMDYIKKAGIPAVLVDRQWNSGYTSYVGPENFTIGQQDGQYIVDKLNGKGVVVVLKGGPADNSIGLNRTNGMLDIVGKISGITVINAPDCGGWSEDGGLKQMENLLAANPRSTPSSAKMIRCAWARNAPSRMPDAPTKCSCAVSMARRKPWSRSRTAPTMPAPA